MAQALSTISCFCFLFFVFFFKDKPSCRPFATVAFIPRVKRIKIHLVRQRARVIDARLGNALDHHFILKNPHAYIHTQHSRFYIPPIILFLLPLFTEYCVCSSTTITVLLCPYGVSRASTCAVQCAVMAFSFLRGR